MGKTFSTGLLTDGISQDSSNNIGIGVAPSGTNKFEVSGSTKLNGNTAITGSLSVSGSTIKIGTTTLSGSLTVSGSSTTIGTTVLSGSLMVSGSITSTSTITAQTLVVQTITSSVLYSSGSNVFGNALSNTQTFTGSVLITGSVGIGTASPSATLDVQTSSGVGSSTASGLSRFITAGTTTAISIGQSNSARKLDIGSQSVKVTSDDFYLVNASANATIFENNGAERMRITSSGSVGIGTTNPTYKFEVSGSSGTLSINPNQASAIIIRGSVASGNFDINNEGASGAIRLYGTSIQLRTAAVDPALSIASTGAATFETAGELNATFNSTNASGGYIRFSRSGAVKGYLGSAAQLLVGGVNDIE